MHHDTQTQRVLALAREKPAFWETSI